jgi:hypothetical protein
MSKSPLASVKERFESKTKLVLAVEKLANKDLWLDRVNGTKGLSKISNAKLIRLHDLLTQAKESFGTREKLVASIVELSQKQKDKAFAESLGGYPLPRLLDLHRTLARADKRSKATPAPKAAAKKAAPKAEQPKAAAAPKKAPAKKPAKKG